MNLVAGPAPRLGGSCGQCRVGDDAPAAPVTPTLLDALAAPRIAAAARGESAAVADLLAVVRPAVVRYCRARLAIDGQPVAAGDQVAHVAMTAVLTALPGYRDPAPRFPAFVYRITTRAIEQSGLGSYSDGPARAPDRPRDFYRGLRCLPASEREIIIARVILGMSAIDIATLVGVSTAAVRRAQHAALDRLRRHLAQGLPAS